MILTKMTLVPVIPLTAPNFRFRAFRALSHTIQGGSESDEGGEPASGSPATSGSVKKKHHWEQRRHTALNGDDTARERLLQVSSYYNQSAIDEVAVSISRRVHLGSWYNNSCDNLTDNHIIVSFFVFNQSIFQTCCLSTRDETLKHHLRDLLTRRGNYR